VLNDRSPETVLRQRVDADPSFSDPGDKPPEFGVGRRALRMVANGSVVSYPDASGFGVGPRAHSECGRPTAVETLAGFPSTDVPSPSERAGPAVTLPSVPNSAPKSSRARLSTITVSF
jgi:hypothetical protein